MMSYRSGRNLHPADARLALPDKMYSFPLRRHVVYEAAGGSLRAAREAVIRATGQRLGTRLLMQIATEAAAGVRDFYQQTASHPRPNPAGAGGRDLLVLSFDATGVNMIGSDLREPAARPLPSGTGPGGAGHQRRAAASCRAAAALGSAVPPGTDRAQPYGGGDRHLRRCPAPWTAADILPADRAERAAGR